MSDTVKLELTIKQSILLNSILCGFEDSLEYNDKQQCWYNNSQCIIAAFSNSDYQTFKDLLKKLNLD